jgi:hypothetical protein
MADVAWLWPIEDQEHGPCCKLLIGLELLGVHKEGFQWFFEFGGSSWVGTASSWRLLGNVGAGPVFITSEDDRLLSELPEPFHAEGPASSALAGRTVIAASISSKSGDLVLEFSGGISLELLQMSAGYPSWEFSVGDKRYVCEGGGRISRHLPAQPAKGVTDESPAPGNE